MIIGFTERRRTLSEGIVPEGEDEFRLTYPVAALRTSERDHVMTFRLLEGISTATVNTREELSDNDVLRNNDAVFGEEREEDDPIEVSLTLPLGNTTLPQDLTTYIRNDFDPEGDECYTVRVFADGVPGVRQLFTCNSEANATNYFCEHEICIIDDDGKIYHINISHVTVSKHILFQGHLKWHLWRQYTLLMRVWVQLMSVSILLSLKLTFLMKEFECLSLTTPFLSTSHLVAH